jgi:hypothetical protein
MFLVAVLRLLHIVAAVLWVGLGFTNVALVFPAIKGTAGMGFLRDYFTAPIAKIVFPVVALTTTLAGILLYVTGSGSRFTQLGNIVLGIGALAGLGAFGHGSATLSKRTNQLAAMVAGNSTDTAAFDSLVEEYLKHARISMIMTIVALLGMGLARYL